MMKRVKHDNGPIIEIAKVFAFNQLLNTPYYTIILLPYIIIILPYIYLTLILLLPYYYQEIDCRTTLSAKLCSTTNFYNCS